MTRGEAGMARLSEGLVEVYTGDGKGKTTAAFGLALRAVGQGLRVCVVQLMKKGWESGEGKAGARLAPELEVHAFGAERWGDRRAAGEDAPWWMLPPSEEDRAQAREALAFAQRAAREGRCDLVVVDEIFPALKQGLVALPEVLSLIRGRARHVELVLTGRDAPKEVCEAADLVTEMQAVKHPYQRGVRARPGIEY